ncbi:MAG: hypothetical protein ACI9WU_005497, partial [Myxococcota bacterium]
PEQQIGHCPADEAGQARALAERFFGWTGLATVEEFIQWSVLGKRVVQKAVSELELVPAAIRGVEGDYLMPEESVDVAVDQRPEVYLLSAQDNLLTLHASPAVLTDPAHHDLELLAMGGRKIPLHKARWVHQRPIFQGGQWIGLWVWDIDTSEVVVRGFHPLSAETQAALEPSIERVADLIETQLDGDSKQNAVDGAPFRRARAAYVRAPG